MPGPIGGDGEGGDGGLGGFPLPSFGTTPTSAPTPTSTPTPTPTPTSTPTPTPTPTGESQGLGASDASTTAQNDALDEPIVTYSDPGVDYLLSTAFPNGPSNPYAPAQGGWTVGPQAVEPYTNVAGQSGPLSPYAGSDVNPYTNSPADGNNPNAFTGGQTVNPFTGFEDASLTSGGGAPDTSQLGSSELEDSWKVASSAEQSQRLASNAPTTAGDLTGSQNVGPVAQPSTTATNYKDPESSTGWGTLISVIPPPASPTAIPQPGSTTATNYEDPESFTGWGTLISVNQPPASPPDPSQTQPPNQAGPGAGTTGAQRDEENWSAAKSGMWDSLVDVAQGFLSMSYPNLGPLGPKLSLDWAKAGPPAPTGDPVRDAELLDNYKSGGWVTTTISLAAPFGAEGLLESAAARVPALGGAGLGEGLGVSTEASESLAPELPGSLPPASPSTEASALYQARNEAADTARKIVQQELNEGWIAPGQQQARFGTWLDALAKTNVRQAVAEGRLPSTFVTSPTVSLSRGYLRSWISAPDVWDTATGRAWDFMAAREAAFYQHEVSYLGSAAFGRLDPAGTTITEIFPLFHWGF
jgi:hypothetical protein